MDSRFSDLCNLAKNTYDFDLQNLRGRVQAYETEVSSLQAELEKLRTTH